MIANAVQGFALFRFIFFKICLEYAESLSYSLEVPELFDKPSIILLSNSLRGYPERTKGTYVEIVTS